MHLTVAVKTNRYPFSFFILSDGPIAGANQIAGIGARTERNYFQLSNDCSYEVIVAECVPVMNFDSGPQSGKSPRKVRIKSITTEGRYSRDVKGAALKHTTDNTASLQCRRIEDGANLIST